MKNTSKHYDNDGRSVSWLKIEPGTKRQVRSDTVLATIFGCLALYFTLWRRNFTFKF